MVDSIYPDMATPPTLPATRPVHRLRPLVRRRSLPRNLQADRAWAFARTLADGARSPEFRELVQQIDGSPWHALAGLDVFEDGQRTYAAIAGVLAAATSEILVEMYILRDDRVGLRLQKLLADAVARGVRVCVLADAVGSFGTSRQYWRALEAAGIEVRLFHPWWHSPLHAWRRDHRKIIVADRAIAFTGGMNIGEEYGSSIRASDASFRDCFVQMDGEVALEMASVFAEGWKRAGGAPLVGLAPVQRSASVRKPPAPEPAILILDSRPGRGQPQTIAVLASLVGAARERLWITTPYFAPPDGGLQILIDAAQRGVDVRLLLPGLTDVGILRYAAHGAYARLLRGGVRVFEYQPAILHAKTMVCDSHLSVVGSANLDFRSLWFNAECNVLVDDARTAGELEAHFVHDLTMSHEITMAEWRTRSLVQRAIAFVARGLRLLL